jgi:hypothetical protein
MFRLFKSMFGNEEPGRYPETLIEQAIQRAVDGTDSRLRTVPGYRKSLRTPVMHAIDAVVALVDSLPAPLAANRQDYGKDERLSTLFASADRMQEVLTNDSALSEFRDSPASGAGQATVLLLAERVEKHVLGMEMEGETVRRDIPQVAVNFQGHRLVDPAATTDEALRQWKRRAFDHLLSLALARITEVASERADLSTQRSLLLRKLAALRQGGLRFDEAQGGVPDAAALQSELEDTEHQLAAIGADDRTLHTYLEIAAAVLTDAQQQLWLECLDLHLDRMNIQRDAQDSSARRISLTEFHNARGQRLVALPLSVTLDELPRRDDFFTAAQRYLG